MSLESIQQAAVERLKKKYNDSYEKGDVMTLEDMQIVLSAEIALAVEAHWEAVKGEKRGSNTSGWCNDCNGHIANEHHQMTCENYNTALSDQAAKHERFLEKL